MRPRVDELRLRELARRLGAVAVGEVTVYLTGGASAVLEGWRASTVDVDVRFEPDSDELLRALPALKEELQVSIELASPPDFIPELPGWRERSPLVLREGTVSVRHFDFYSQVLAKVERGLEQDERDVQTMLDRGLVRAERVRELFAEIEPELYRYPSIHPGRFRERLTAALAGAPSSGGVQESGS